MTDKLSDALTGPNGTFSGSLINREPCANGCRFVTGTRAGQLHPATWDEKEWTKSRGWILTGRLVCGFCTEYGMLTTPTRIR